MTTRSPSPAAGADAPAMGHYPHIGGLLFGTPLLLPAEYALEMAEALMPRLERGQRPAMPITPRAVGADRVALTLVEGETVRIADGRFAYGLTPDGVAIVPVCGELIARYSWMKAQSGVTSYDVIRLCLTEIGRDYRVRAVMLDVDSPGGQPAYCDTTAAELRALAEIKPVWSAANTMACSAGYWLAAGATRMTMAKFAAVGSVGAVILHRDCSGADEQAGLRYTPITAGARKVEAWSHAPLDDATRGRLQARVDDARAQFVEAVVALRGGAGLTKEQVLATEAAVLSDEEALSLHLVDAVEPFEDTLGALTDHIRPAARSVGASKLSAQQGGPMLTPPGGAAATQQLAATTETDGTVTPPCGDQCDQECGAECKKPGGAAAKAAAPAAPATPAATAATPAVNPVTSAVAAAQAAGVAAGTISALMTAGAAQERERLTALESLALPGMEALHATARAQGWTPEQFAMQQTLTQRRLGTTHLNALATDAAATPQIPPAPAAAVVPGASGKPKETDNTVPLETRAKQEWEASAALQTEFGGSFNAYLAYRKADTDGRLHHQTNLS